MQNVDHIYSAKKRYYAAKQLYHFVRPGSQRIGAGSDSQNLVVSAFRKGDSTTLGGLKQGGSNRVQVTVPETARELTWALYQTTRELNCVKTDELLAKNGVVEFDLPDEAIFTLASVPHQRQ